MKAPSQSPHQKVTRSRACACLTWQHAASEAEPLVWCGRWAKAGEAVNVRFSKPGNDVPFLESDLHQSLHATMQRKNVPCEYVEKTMPTSSSLTGPWEQTMAAAAALEIVNDFVNGIQTL